MKAAVLHQYGTNPKAEDFTAPVPADASQALISVKAASIKQIDKLKAGGKHYTRYAAFPAVAGFDGAGILEDGTRVYAQGITGMMAEKALIAKGSWIALPDEIDFAVASALPNALIGSDAALQLRSGFKKGDVVLINGATGASGQMAVQLAKYRGASTVIATGRNLRTLEKLKALGADETIALGDDDETIIARLKDLQSATPIDIVLDYLWGHPVELLLSALKNIAPRKVKIVTIGEMAGANITLPSAVLRSTQIELYGSGIGSISGPDLGHYMKSTLPEMLQLVTAGKLKFEVETVPLSEVEIAWQRESEGGKRIVITM